MRRRFRAARLLGPLLSAAAALALRVPPAGAIVVTAEIDLSGVASEIEAQGDFLFVPTAAGLDVLDLRDPRRPVRLPSLATSPVRALALDGDLAVLGCEDSVRIVDVSDPHAVHELGHLDLPSGSLDVAVAADHAHAFVSTVSGVQVVDFADPAVPVAGVLAGEPLLRMLARVGDGLFGVIGEHGVGGVGVLDVTDPAAPVARPSIAPAGTADEYGSPGTVAVRAEGDHLRVWDESQYGESVLRLFDVTDPAAPSAIDQTNMWFAPSALALENGILHAANCGLWNDCSVVRTPLSDILAPQVSHWAFLSRSHEVPYPTGGSGFLVRGDVTYIASGTRLRAIDFSHPDWPRRVGALPYSGAGGLHRIQISGARAHVAADAAGIAVLDLSDPAAPALEGERDFHSGRRAIDIAAAPPIALVADPAGVRVATVENPANPYILADPLVATWGVELEGGVGYSASGSQGLVTWDLADPVHPAIRGSAAVTDARDVAVAGDLAYVVGFDAADFYTELVIVDVSDPASPSEVGRLGLPHPNLSGLDVEVVGTIAYVAVDSEVQIVDVSVPASPLLLGSFDTCGSATELEVSEGRLLAAGPYCGLAVFDLSDPVRPFELGILHPGSPTMPVGGVAAAGATKGRLAYVGDAWQGNLEVWDLGAEYVPEPDSLVGASAACGALAWLARRRRARRR